MAALLSLQLKDLLDQHNEALLEAVAAAFRPLIVHTTAPAVLTTYTDTSAAVTCGPRRAPSLTLTSGHFLSHYSKREVAGGELGMQSANFSGPTAIIATRPEEQTSGAASHLLLMTAPAESGEWRQVGEKEEIDVLSPAVRRPIAVGTAVKTYKKKEVTQSVQSLDAFEKKPAFVRMQGKAAITRGSTLPENGVTTLSLQEMCLLFTGTKELFPEFPFHNGSTPVSIELERPVSRHCHRGVSLSSDNQQKLHARKKLYFACVVCFIFMIGEIVGGYLAHSLAIMTDAAHLLTDLGSMCVSIFSLWISTRPPTKSMNYGWHRSEILGALASILSIWIVTGVLVYLATVRIINNDYDIDGHVMLITSGCAVGVNIIMAYILHQSTTFHGHSHGSGYEKIGDSPSSGLALHLGHHGNTSVRAAFVHVIGDLLQSIGVLVAAIVIYFKPQYKIADPVCTFLFSVFVLGTTITVLQDVFWVLMEGAPRSISYNSVKEVLLMVQGVRSVHSLRLSALTLTQNVVSVHLAIDDNCDSDEVLREATDVLQKKFEFFISNIQVERYMEDMAECQQCQDPMG
ncbi:probable proton-coupled zinc antiporter SLC30A3 [Bombina bombina]|uniref:probable proton-coupled zinc antiporter SLC30A3 n=1 Tax=Bombina bombina TaxID=8345 RepID=UPI00235A688C|nr:probable proton-coupled zinc antiporter SLC30A3 [Bombina bombina]